MAFAELILLSENTAEPPFAAEHGLSIYLKYRGKSFIFDTGTSRLFLENAEKAGVDPAVIEGVILSHGHNDHTGGLQYLSPEKIWCAPDITRNRFSRHPGKPIRDLTIPAASADILRKVQCMEINGMTEIFPGMFLTGPIPRVSGETCGGPFYCDPEGKTEDLIPDEQALLLEEGIMIQGCCHAGIINTLEFCKKNKPDWIPRTVIGGLHLISADHNRLRKTADYLKKTEIQTMILLHCTGENAVEFLKNELPDIKILTPSVNGKTLFL